ncbi:DNA-binding protein SMUBP-2 [Coemansia sp. RSA 2618]|nr:DNA-binding protein SMUBP-2 [Coemansia sp. RSA 2618]
MARIRKSIQHNGSDVSSSPILDGNIIVLTTLCSTGGPQFTGRYSKFNAVIIDESAQALEGECWVAGVQTSKLILAGDHHQLPPTLVSQENQSLKQTASSSNVGNGKLLTTTMFERVRSKLGDRACQMLTTQYRMHSTIMKVSNENLYDSGLIAHHSVASHLLTGLPGVLQTANTRVPLVFIDTGAAYMRESIEKTSPAKPGMLGAPEQKHG